MTRLQDAHRRAANGTADLADLARIVGDHRGWTAKPGGYVKAVDGRTIAHGWEAAGRRLAQRRVIVRDRLGRLVIDWPRLDR